VPAGLLIVGTLLVPTVSALKLAHDPRDWSALLGLGLLGLGWLGLTGVVRTLLVLHEPQTFRPALTALCLACGVAAVLLFCFAGQGLKASWAKLLIGGAPIACTAHLVFLARRSLFA